MLDKFIAGFQTVYSNVVSWLMTPFKRDDQHEFKPLLVEIEDSPLSPLGRFTFWIVIAILITTILWMFLGVVDVVITVRGKIIPDGELKVVQSFTPGVIRSILVKECDYVTKGQVLMVIDSSSAKADLSNLNQNMAVAQLDILRLESLLNGKNFVPGRQFSADQVRTAKDMYSSAAQNQNERLGGKKAELGRIDEQLKGLQDSTDYIRKMLTSATEKQLRLKRVLDIIPQADFERAQSEVLSYQSNLTDNLSKIMELRQQQSQLRQELSSMKQTFRETMLQDYAVRQNKKAELEALIVEKEFYLSKTVIVSPVDGYIQKILINTVGGVLSAAQPLISIVPSDVPLMIKASLVPTDKGFVQKGMPVAIKLDAFSFQKYGMINGMVVSTSKDTYEPDNNGPIYDLYITPFDKFLTVEGRREYISTGMTLTAEIKIGKRRIIEFFVYPLIKYLDEGVSVQ